MMILMFLFWAVVIYFIFKLLTRNDIINKVTSGKSPEELLKERYARGEITKEQYEEMLQDLRK
ncbi:MULTISPECIES: SHOCT domain-containing protein [Carboxydothermus]|nr:MULTISPECIES: SHOCT domain-containing protein [Carboxydothermus]NYE57840.1 putative membrane protein [Carboxydothermus ferrireducens DSM 11255]